MTEYGASVFVFFFLGEYSSLILMSTLMSVFFLGGHHCPDLHKLLLDPIMFLYFNLESIVSNYLNSTIIYSYLSNLNGLKYLVITKYFNPELVLEYNNITKFSNRDIIFEFINLLIDKIQGSYILGFKIIIVVFFYI
jgi:hypothetical protein